MMSTEAILNLTATNSVQRFPRLTEESGEGKAESALDKLSLAELVGRANEMLADDHTRRVKLGEVFFCVKHKVGHGHWRDFYEEKFGGSGRSFRTAQRYIKLWRKAEARARRDRLTLFKSGTSPDSREVDIATAEVQAEVGDAPKREPDYRLALCKLGAVRRAAVIRLWGSRYRASVEKKIIAVLDAALISFHFATKQALKAEDDDREVSGA